MKRKILLLVPLVCLAVIGTVTVGASNVTKADKESRLNAARAEKEQIENKWEDESQNQDSKGQKSKNQNPSNTNLKQENERLKSLEEEIGTLEVELGEYDYIADLERRLDSIEGVIQDNQLADANGYFDYPEETLEKLRRYNEANLELVAKYRRRIQENEYNSPEELYQEFEKDNQEVEEVYFWR